MIYVYRRKSSPGARALVNGLLEVGLPARRLMDLGKIPAQGPQVGGHPRDTIVAWGENVERPGYRILNGAPIRAKFTDAEILKAEGVSTIEVSRTKPIATPPVPQVDPAIAIQEEVAEMALEFSDLALARSPVYLQGVRDLETGLERLANALRAPIPVAQAVPLGEWIGRRNDHIGGNDLLHPPIQPEFWVKKETFLQELRVHSFNGKSIRAGVKIPRGGFPNPSQWIRSWDGGWMISYDGVTSTNAHRNIAHAAVKALGLTFGAVDIGQRADGSLVVLEVNRAPGLEGGTVTAYANAINTLLTA